MRSKLWVRPTAAAAVAALVVLAAHSAASADVAVSASLTMPSPTAVGERGLLGWFTVINTNTPPNQAEANRVTSLRLAPSCGSAGTVQEVCPTPDRKVFVVGAAKGGDGTACAGMAFNFTTADDRGVVTFTPPSPVFLKPPGGSPGSDRCTVRFRFRVVRLPTIDVDPSRSGAQTRTNLEAQTRSSSGLVVTARLSLVVTVVP